MLRCGVVAAAVVLVSVGIDGVRDGGIVPTSLYACECAWRVCCNVCIECIMRVCCAMLCCGFRTFVRCLLCPTRINSKAGTQYLMYAMIAIALVSVGFNISRFNMWE